MSYAPPNRFGPGNRIAPRRAAFEFYPTPPEATRALLSVEAFDGPVWEPACGDGAIARELLAAGYDVTSTDLADHGYGTPGIDFLKESTARAKHIVTNPPYGRGLADRFIGQALKLTRATGGSVAMLLNLASLCHPTRHPKFVHTPPAAVYALDELVCWPAGVPSNATRSTLSHRYCWLIWKPGHTGRSTFWWLSTRPFIGRSNANRVLPSTANAR
jgi:hypothetical protein